jgi:DEAD/DEAH box helicase domain-containing protein
MLSRRTKTLEELLRWVEKDLPGEVAVHRMLPPRQAVTAPFGPLDPRLVAALAERGVTSLFTHQQRAVELACSGRNVAVVTPTASGKSLCYTIPVVQGILEDPAARALYLFPTKALSQDQMAELYALIEKTGADIRTFTYDGDTPSAARQKIRTAGHVVITNPDMLHTGILPHHTKWVKLFENLRYVVLDELHTYRGIFGSHLANTLRRLKRICAFYGSKPVFICCSATIRNPGELAEALLEEPVALVAENGAPRGEKHVLVYNPPLVNRQLGIRRSALLETARIATEALASRIPTIVFTRSRINVELLLTYIRQGLAACGGSPDIVAGYRGGYLPSERRTIEKGLRDGTILGVVSTNALELGVDIGSLSLALLHGYPGGIAAAWQQMGRAGRRSGLSAAILVASSFPLDQFLANQPDYLFNASPEHARINPNNLYILVNHVKCAAFEKPFVQGENLGTAETGDVLNYLEEQGVLHLAEGRYFWQDASFPAENVSLRSATSENYVILDVTHPERPVVLGEVDRPSAPMLIHPEAVYFHAGQPYQVMELDQEGMRCLVKRVDADYYTDADMAVRLQLLDVFDSAESWGWGEVLLASRPTVYKKIRLGTHENVGYGYVHLGEEQMHTTGMWLLFGEEVLPSGWSDDLRSSVLAGTAHLLRSTAPLFLMCDRTDISVHSHVRDPHWERGAIYLVDNVPGGVGLAETAFAMRGHLIRAAKEALAGCPCERGCPGCIGIFSGESGNVKASVRELLGMLGRASA